MITVRPEVGTMPVIRLSMYIRARTRREASRNTRPPQNRNRAIAAHVLVLVLTCTLIISVSTVPTETAAQGPPEKGAGPPPKPVEIGCVEERLVRDQVTLLGDVEAFTEGDVHTEVAGLVETFPVREGLFVKKGELLAELDSSQLRLELEVAQEEKANSEALLEVEEKEFKRFQMLSKSASVSAQDFEREKAQAEAAEHRTMMLDAKIRLLKDLISKKRITAPFDGYVVEEHVHVGMWVQRGGRIVRMVQVEPIYVTVPLPQSYLNQIAVGDETTVTVRSFTGPPLKGAVDAVIALGDTSSRTFPVKIRLDNPDHKLKPGMLAYALFKVGDAHKAVVVPKDAVVIDPSGGKTVYVVEDGKVRPVPVMTGSADNSFIEVKTDMLSVGQKVVTVGNERLRPGGSVSVIGKKQTCGEAKQSEAAEAPLSGAGSRNSGPSDG